MAEAHRAGLLAVLRAEAHPAWVEAPARWLWEPRLLVVAPLCRLLRLVSGRVDSVAQCQVEARPRLEEVRLHRAVTYLLSVMSDGPVCLARHVSC